VEERDWVRIHPASINCQLQVLLWNFEVVGVGVTHRSGVGVSVCIQNGQLQCPGWVLKKSWIWGEMTTLPVWSRSEVYKLENDLQRAAQNRQICRGMGVAAGGWV
jgi:hypothetical protein